MLKDTEYHAESDGSGQQEAEDPDLPPFVLQVGSQGDVGLHPAEQRAQAKCHQGAKVVDHLLSEYLKPKQIN